MDESLKKRTDEELAEEARVHAEEMFDAGTNTAYSEKVLRDKLGRETSSSTNTKDISSIAKKKRSPPPMLELNQRIVQVGMINLLSFVPGPVKTVVDLTVGVTCVACWIQIKQS